MRLFGGAVAVLVALLATVRYRRFVYGGVEVGEAFVTLLTGLRRHIAVSGAPIDKYMSDLKDGPLCEYGFYDEYRACGRLSVAFSRVRSRLYLPEGMAAELSAVFERLGRSDVSGELRLLDAEISELGRMGKKFRAEAEGSVRAVSVMIVAVTLGILILLL